LPGQRVWPFAALAWSPVPPLAWRELVPRVFPEVAPLALHRLARPISRLSAPPALLA